MANTQRRESGVRKKKIPETFTRGRLGERVFSPKTGLRLRLRLSLFLFFSFFLDWKMENGMGMCVRLEGVIEREGRGVRKFLGEESERLWGEKA